MCSPPGRADARVGVSWLEADIVQRCAEVAGLQVGDHRARVPARGQGLAHERGERQFLRPGHLQDAVSRRPAATSARAAATSSAASGCMGADGSRTVSVPGPAMGTRNSKNWVARTAEDLRWVAISPEAFTPEMFSLPEGEVWKAPAGAYKRCGGPS